MLKKPALKICTSFMHQVLTQVHAPQYISPHSHIADP